jgi:hypothetical protein
MSPTPDDYKCWIFGAALLLYYIAQRWFGRCLQVTWLNNLARFYRIYALLCGTKFFILALFLYLVAKDICSMIERRVVERLISSMAFTQVPDTPTPNEEPASANTQLISWMSDDAEDAWKQKMEAYDAKLQQSEYATAAFRTSTEEHSSLSDACYEEDSIFGASATGNITTPCPVTRVTKCQAVVCWSSSDF